MSLTVASLIAARADAWARAEKDDSRSLPGVILRHMEESGKLRRPQIGAITARLWLQFSGENKKIADLIIDGHLTDFSLAQTYEYTDNMKYYSHVRQFFIAYAKANDMPGIERKARDYKRKPGEWEEDLRKLLRDMPYPNRTYSLPMGAGKTYLMAAFICLDLHFSRLMPKDRRFAHNFAVFAPHASKTAILPSLKTIRQFNPEWVLPESAAAAVRRELHVEILDDPKTARPSMRVNNPNLEKVNRLLHTRKHGLVFITNAEKVVLEQYTDTPLLDGANSNTDSKKSNESNPDLEKSNELRERMAEIPALAVFLDEVHHAYQSSGEAEKTLRRAVGVINKKENLREVSGFSGTPYIKTKTEIAGERSQSSQLPDVAHNFPLAEGIGLFLKTPKVLRQDDVREERFIHTALNHFFREYDIKYKNGANSKIAFYCPSIAVLNEEILPAVLKWYANNRTRREEEIFSYYSNGGTTYPLPSGALAEFHNLDSPHSDKRVILLVAVGKEGWDCRSLTAVALPRRTTAKNFVLQTSCRCLREVENAAEEKALIVLGEGNYQILEKQLKESHDMSVSEFESGDANTAPVLARKPRLGKLHYRQISAHFIMESEKAGAPPQKQLAEFIQSGFENFIRANDYTPTEETAEITRRGRLTGTQQEAKMNGGELPLETFSDFLIELQGTLWGQKTAAELSQQYGEELTQIYEKMRGRGEWFANHPDKSEEICRAAVRETAACFADEREYRREEILEDVEIELLEWSRDARIGWGGGNFLPELEKREFHGLCKRISRVETYLEEDKCDPQDISFNYAPYRFDSGFEVNAILEMLKQEIFSDLELYYNGLTHGGLESFSIKTPHGRYTPDFLLLQRLGGKPYQKGGKNAPIEKVLIIETKGALYYDEFRAKEKFVKTKFLRYNPKFDYVLFMDEGGKNDFERHLPELRKKVQEWTERK